MGGTAFRWVGDIAIAPIGRPHSHAIIPHRIYTTYVCNLYIRKLKSWNVFNGQSQRFTSCLYYCAQRNASGHHTTIFLPTTARSLARNVTTKWSRKLLLLSRDLYLYIFCAFAWINVLGTTMEKYIQTYTAYICIALIYHTSSVYIIFLTVYMNAHFRWGSSLSIYIYKYICNEHTGIESNASTSKLNCKLCSHSD